MAAKDAHELVVHRKPNQPNTSKQKKCAQPSRFRNRGEILALQETEINNLSSQQRFYDAWVLTASSSLLRLALDYFKFDVLSDEEKAKKTIALAKVQEDLAKIEFEALAINEDLSEIEGTQLIAENNHPTLFLTDKTALTPAEMLKIRYALSCYNKTNKQAFAEYAFKIVYEASPFDTILAAEKLAQRLFLLVHPVLLKLKRTGVFENTKKESDRAKRRHNNNYKSCAKVLKIHLELLRYAYHASPEDSDQLYDNFVEARHRVSRGALEQYCIKLLSDPNRILPEYKIEQCETLIAINDIQKNRPGANRHILDCATSCYQLMTKQLELEVVRLDLEGVRELIRKLPILLQMLNEAREEEDVIRFGALEALLGQYPLPKLADITTLKEIIKNRVNKPDACRQILTLQQSCYKLILDHLKTIKFKLSKNSELEETLIFIQQILNEALESEDEAQFIAIESCLAKDPLPSLDDIQVALSPTATLLADSAWPAKALEDASIETENIPYNVPT